MQGVPDNGTGRRLVIRDETSVTGLPRSSAHNARIGAAFVACQSFLALSVDECRFGLVWLVAGRRLQPSKRTMPKILLHEQ